MARPWPGYGQAMSRPWPGHGQAMARPWPGHGQAMARPWPGDCYRNWGRVMWPRVLCSRTSIPLRGFFSFFTAWIPLAYHIGQLFIGGDAARTAFAKADLSGADIAESDSVVLDVAEHDIINARVSSSAGLHRAKPACATPKPNRVKTQLQQGLRHVYKLDRP